VVADSLHGGGDSEMTVVLALLVKVQIQYLSIDTMQH
jgi:hypothetical protein